MQALVTNDDGVESNGIELLTQAARSCGLDVTTVGPTWDASGSSAALAAVAHEGRVWVHHADRDGDAVGGDGDAVDRDGDTPGSPESPMAMDASPAFIVRSALSGAFGPPPDLVLSGVNEGTTTGRVALHSGTLGAALTSSARGYPSLAVSAVVGTSEETVLHVARRAVGWLLKLQHPCVLNVNIPDRSLADLRGAVPTTLDPGGNVEATVTEAGGGFVPVTLRDPPGASDQTTDQGAVDSGFVSVTALRPPREDPSVALEELLKDSALK